MATNQARKFPFETHRNAIADDYELSTTVLGKGINGSVVKCKHRGTGLEGALKVIL